MPPVALPPVPSVPAPSTPIPVPKPSVPIPAVPAPAVPGVPSPAVPAPSGLPSGVAASGGAAPASSAPTGASRTRAAPGAPAPAGGSGASETSVGSAPGGAARGAAEPRVVNAVAQVAAACRAVGRLVVAPVEGSRPAAATRPTAGRDAVAATAAALFARPDGLASSVGTRGAAGVDDGGGPSSVAPGLAGLAPADVSVLAALSIGLILLAVTALAVYSLAAGRTASPRRGAPPYSARGTRRDPGRRGDAFAALVLVVASLAFWSAVALWLLTRAG